MRTAQQVVRAIGSIQDEKILNVLKDMKNKNPIDWTILPGFTLTDQEVAEKASLDVKEVNKVLSAFSVTADERNDDFQTVNDFNTSISPSISLFFRNMLTFEWTLSSPNTCIPIDHGTGSCTRTHRHRK